MLPSPSECALAIVTARDVMQQLLAGGAEYAVAASIARQARRGVIQQEHVDVPLVCAQLEEAFRPYRFLLQGAHITVSVALVCVHCAAALYE